jgi:hypothetical protein
VEFMDEIALLRNSYHGRLELSDQVFEELKGHGRCCKYHSLNFLAVQMQDKTKLRRSTSV